MAVYERAYKRYTGRLTPQQTRLLVIPRFALKKVLSSRFFLVFLIFSLSWPSSQVMRIYLYHNASTILEGFPDMARAFTDILAIDAEFFKLTMHIQCMFAFVAALFIGPGLVSKDLANNALPLYLSRPISRAEYVLGKFSILGILLSLITWIPGLTLYLLHANYAGLGWAFDNLRLAVSMFVGSWAWIVTVGFLALALSAWVKWRLVAGFMMVVVFLGGGFFGFIIDLLFKTSLGHLANLPMVLNEIWIGLFGINQPVKFPFWAAWLSLLSFIGLCIWLLDRKVRAYEVVS